MSASVCQECLHLVTLAATLARHSKSVFALAVVAMTIFSLGATITLFLPKKNQQLKHTLSIHTSIIVHFWGNLCMEILE